MNLIGMRPFQWGEMILVYKFVWVLALVLNSLS